MSEIPVFELSEEELQKEYLRVKLTKRGNVSGMVVNGFLTPVMGVTVAGLGVAAVRHHNNKKRMLELEEELRRRGLPIPSSSMIANVSAVCGGGMASIFLCEGRSFMPSDGAEPSVEPSSPAALDPCTIPTPAAAPPPQEFHYSEKMEEKHEANSKGDIWTPLPQYSDRPSYQSGQLSLASGVDEFNF
ncbi:hypothetical protein FRC00_011840 [Tulasnella sp. 408]|nr:hypothetical protein FRC00_011840 [Tulasnella sp. 408]